MAKRKPTVAEAEVLSVLAAIERGEVTLSREGKDLYAGDQTYVASNGWKLVVFNDCNSWDYLDSVVTPDGIEHDFWWFLGEPIVDGESCDEPYADVRAYRAPDDVARVVYLIGSDA